MNQIYKENPPGQESVGQGVHLHCLQQNEHTHGHWHVCAHPAFHCQAERSDSAAVWSVVLSLLPHAVCVLSHRWQGNDEDGKKKHPDDRLPHVHHRHGFHARCLSG